MRKLLIMVACLIFLISCRAVTTSTIPYTPNPQNVKTPTVTMKKILEQQPPAFAYMPNSVEVDDQCIKMAMTGTIPASHSWTEYICYKNIGKISLSHNTSNKVWIVKINDINHNFMYWVYSYDRKDAEQFIDAISNYIKK